MIPDKIVIHASASDDLPSLQWAGILAYQTSYRIDGVSVSYPEWQSRKNTGQGTTFLEPWSDIGYHEGCEQIEGKYITLMGRPWDKIGAHCQGHNGHTLGFCFVGNFQKQPPPLKQIVQGAKTIALMCRLFNTPVENIVQHRDLNNTECPGEFFPMTYLKIKVQEAL